MSSKSIMYKVLEYLMELVKGELIFSLKTKEKNYLL